MGAGMRRREFLFLSTNANKTSSGAALRKARTDTTEAESRLLP